MFEIYTLDTKIRVSPKYKKVSLSLLMRQQ